MLLLKLPVQCTLALTSGGGSWYSLPLRPGAALRWLLDTGAVVIHMTVDSVKAII